MMVGMTVLTSCSTLSSYPSREYLVTERGVKYRRILGTTEQVQEHCKHHVIKLDNGSPPDRVFFYACTKPPFMWMMGTVFTTEEFKDRVRKHEECHIDKRPDLECDKVK